MLTMEGERRVLLPADLFYEEDRARIAARAKNRRLKEPKYAVYVVSDRRRRGGTLYAVARSPEMARGLYADFVGIVATLSEGVYKRQSSVVVKLPEIPDVSPEVFDVLQRLAPGITELTAPQREAVIREVELKRRKRTE